MPERIQLSRQRGWRKPEGAVVVSRPSRWGNPFKSDGTPVGRSITVERFPAPWDLLGNGAGPARYGFMVGLLVGRRVQPVGCLAYIVNGSPGASGTAALAQLHGIPVRRPLQEGERA